MDLLLVAGAINNILYSKIAYKKNIINKQAIYSSHLVEVLEQKNIRFDGILILDQGIDQTLEELHIVLREIQSLYSDKPIIFFTNNLEVKFKFDELEVYLEEKLRISDEAYNTFFKDILKIKKLTDQSPKDERQQTKQPIMQEEIIEQASKKTKSSIFSKVFKKTKVVEDTEDEKFKYISKGISRVISVTGHRGVGVTSTVVNIGYEAAKRNLSTIIVDLDIHNRTTNLYFSEFIRQAEKDEHIAASLLKCLAKPQDYKNSACYVTNKLWLTSLTYDFKDHKLMNQFYTATKLTNMLTVLRQYFNVILLDMPFDILKDFEESIPNIDVFALCTNNSQYSIITTLRNMGNFLSGEHIGYMNAKSKLVITKYNDRVQYENEFFTPDKVSDIFASDLCEDLSIKMPVAGYIRYDSDFDVQIENDIPITESSKEFKEYYSNILLRMMEGVN